MKAVFRFYIDQNGRARMPVLVRVDGELPKEPVVMMEQAIERWVFQAPKVEGKRVVAVVEQPIIFDPQAG